MQDKINFIAKCNLDRMKLRIQDTDQSLFGDQKKKQCFSTPNKIAKRIKDFQHDGDSHYSS